jgi:hypothetical protein
MTLPRTIFAALLLAGCAAQRPQLTEQQRDQVNHDFVACLHAAANKLDDGISPASTVALGLRSLCNRELNAVGDAIIARAGGSLYAANVYQQRYEDEIFMREATTAVLIERANRAGETNHHQ